MTKFAALTGFPITASGNSGPVAIENAGDIEVAVSIATSTGTDPRLDLWMRTSTDNGLTWYDRPADKVLRTSDDASGASVQTDVRNIVAGKTTLTEEKFLAVYNGIAADCIAFFWAVSGTSPSFPATITVIPK